ncbi:MAG TPA: hypothetical protein VGN36_04865 [Sphingorhabdus sp.]|jgi:hypothetical protein|nr:hypothetical protein [Sphingorhabdus sp.]
MIYWLLIATLSPTLAASEPAPSAPEPLKIDILVKPPVEKCNAKASDEIVVCAEKFDNESQRLRPIENAEIYDKDESRAEFSVSENVRMAAEVESKELGGGVTSKAIMARVKIKF